MDTADVIVIGSELLVLVAAILVAVLTVLSAIVGVMAVVTRLLRFVSGDAVAAETACVRCKKARATSGDRCDDCRRALEALLPCTTARSSLFRPE